MESKLLGRYGAIGVAVVTSAMAASAAAPKQAVCAMQQAVACNAVEVCERALPAGVNLPALMRFDLDAGIVESKHQDGAVRTSKIGSSSDQGKSLVLQGVDGGHPWAMQVDTKSGQFTLSVLREADAFVGFGVCSAKILD